MKSIIIFTLLVTRTFQLNPELVFDLQYFFKSDVILVATDNDELSKQFYKLRNFQAFIATINLDEQFEKTLHDKFLAPYQNTLVVTTNINKLLKKLIYLPLSIIASMIWVNFIDGDVSDKIRDVYIPFNCRLFLIKEINEDSFEITDVYQVTANSSKIYSTFAYYYNNEIKFVGASDFNVRRKDLRNHQFVVSKSIFPEFEGQSSRLWKMLAQGMNFSILSHPTGLGKINPNGSLTGLFKLIDEHKIDGTAINYVFTQERSLVLDYIFPTLISETRMYLDVQPKLNWSSYTAPFSTELWISIFAWIILDASIIHVMLLGLKKIRCDMERYFVDSLFDVLITVFNQGAEFKNLSISLSILYFTTYVLAIILAQYYSGAILSYITVQNRIVPFRNLEQLIEDGRYKVLAMEGSYGLAFLTTDQGPQATAIREKKLLAPPVDMTKSGAGFYKLCEGQYVLLSSNVILDGHEPCYIAEINAAVFHESWGILTSKGFPFKNALTKLMRQIQFSGLEKLKKKTVIDRKDDSQDFVPLTLELIFPIFLLHCAFLFLCPFILFCEIYFYKNRKKFVKKCFKNLLN